MSRHVLVALWRDPKTPDDLQSSDFHRLRSKAAATARALRSADERVPVLLIAGVVLILMLALTSLALRPQSVCSGLSGGKAEVRCPLLF